MTCKDGFLGVDGDSHTPFTTLSPAATAPLRHFLRGATGTTFTWLATGTTFTWLVALNI